MSLTFTDYKLIYRKFLATMPNKQEREALLKYYQILRVELRKASRKDSKYYFDYLQIKQFVNYLQNN